MQRKNGASKTRSKGRIVAGRSVKIDNESWGIASSARFVTPGLYVKRIKRKMGMGMDERGTSRGNRTVQYRKERKEKVKKKRPLRCNHVTSDGRSEPPMHGTCERKRCDGHPMHACALPQCCTDPHPQHTSTQLNSTQPTPPQRQWHISFPSQKLSRPLLRHRRIPSVRSLSTQSRLT